MPVSLEQEEEAEVLQSIFEGDEAFKRISDREFQYKVGEDGSKKSFLLTIKWPEEYPSCKPEINLDSFYNNHVVDDVKQKIITGAYEEVATSIGDAVTYTIIDWAKQNAESLVVDQPDSPQKLTAQATKDAGKLYAPVMVKKEKKEQLTKAQKRKLADRLDSRGERPRGWNWVDIVKHLAQTGKANND